MANSSYRYDQICELRRCCGSDSKLSAKDIKFGSSLCDQYFSRLSLSEPQWFWVGKLLENAGALPNSSGAPTNEIEEIFNGTPIKALFIETCKRLKFPKLRYQTDGGSKVIFSYVCQCDSKWKECTFIDNGGKENKKRYGFIDRWGKGRINRDAPPEIKALIRSIAVSPVNHAVIQGKKYSNCCFCGLELTNKSSLHYGYGPICAGNYGLPWGDTGAVSKADEAAARKELEHIQLMDLE